MRTQTIRRGVLRRWRELEWPLVGVAALVALALGVIGFARYYAKYPAPGEQSPLDLLYLAIQLIPLQSGALPKPLPWELEVARLALPLVAGYAATKTLALLFHDQLQQVYLRRMHDHTIICGLGRKGMLLAAAYSESEPRRRAVVIEKNPDNDHVATCREAGIMVVTGDATDPDVLARARVHRARRLISVCGSDEANAEVAVQAHELVKRERSTPWHSTRRMLSCVVHLVDPELCDLVRGSELRSHHTPGFRLSFFNVFSAGAQAMVEPFPGIGEAAGATKPPHVLIVGLGQMGESVAAQAARRWWDQHRNGVRFKLTIVDRLACSKAELLSLRYPRLPDVCDLIPVEIDVRSPEFYRAQFLDGDPPVTVVYVCLDDDARALSAALDLHERLHRSQVRIVVRMSEETGLAQLPTGTPRDRGFEDLHAFGLLNRTCVPALVERSVRETLAQAIHRAYQQTRDEQGQTLASNPALADWYDLADNYKDSSRAQADAVGEKLQESYDVVTRRDWGAAIVSFSDEEIEALARAEHKRFVQERMADGWTYAPGPKNDAKKTNPTLVPWEDLTENDKDVDRDMMRALPASLAAIGYDLRRRTLVIGVTGHRTLTELDKIGGGIAGALARIEGAFPRRELVVCSALAEGADRLVARHVLGRPRARLVVPLPLARSDYMQDFQSAESKEEFVRLLGRAERVIELPAAATRDEAYEAGGTYVLDHADVLIAVWDGQGAQGQAGTAEVVRRARARALALAWVHAGNRRPGTVEPTSLGAEQGTVTFENFPAEGRPSRQGEPAKA